MLAADGFRSIGCGGGGSTLGERCGSLRTGLERVDDYSGRALKVVAAYCYRANAIARTQNIASDRELLKKILSGSEIIELVIARAICEPGSQQGIITSIRATVKDAVSSILIEFDRHIRQTNVIGR